MENTDQAISTSSPHQKPIGSPMNFHLLLLRLVAFFVMVISWSPAHSHAETNSAANIPLIVMEGVPFNDAIRNLARQSGKNYIFDPVAEGLYPGPDGNRFKAPTINARLENVTTEEAIARLLKEQKLAWIDNPATTVARITFADRGVKPVDATQVVGNTNKIIPLLTIDDMPLGDALSQLTKDAGLNAEVDKKVLAPIKDDVFSIARTVSFRWENISSAQALAALLDAHDLQLTKLAEGEKYRIEAKPKADGKAPEPSQKTRDR